MITPSDLINGLVVLLIGIVGWNVKGIQHQLDRLTTVQGRNTNRLVRIETKLGITADLNGDADDLA